MTATNGSGGAGTGTGSLSDEAGKLFEALQDWISERAGGVAGLLGDNLATGSTECRLCPVCQLIGLLRAAQPAVAEHLADAGLSLLAAYRAAMEAHERQWSAQRPAGRDTGVEHIDIAD